MITNYKLYNAIRNPSKYYKEFNIAKACLDNKVNISKEQIIALNSAGLGSSRSATLFSKEEIEASSIESLLEKISKSWERNVEINNIIFDKFIIENEVFHDLNYIRNTCPYAKKSDAYFEKIITLYDYLYDNYKIISKFIKECQSGKDSDSDSSLLDGLEKSFSIEGSSSTFSEGIRIQRIPYSQGVVVHISCLSHNSCISVEVNKESNTIERIAEGYSYGYSKIYTDTNFKKLTVEVLMTDILLHSFLLNVKSKILNNHFKYHNIIATDILNYYKFPSSLDFFDFKTKNVQTLPSEVIQKLKSKDSNKLAISCMTSTGAHTIHPYYNKEVDFDSNKIYELIFNKKISEQEIKNFFSEEKDYYRKNNFIFNLRNNNLNPVNMTFEEIESSVLKASPNKVK